MACFAFESLRRLIFELYTHLRCFVDGETWMFVVPFLGAYCGLYRLYEDYHHSFGVDFLLELAIPFSWTLRVAYALTDSALTQCGR